MGKLLTCGAFTLHKIRVNIPPRLKQERRNLMTEKESAMESAKTQKEKIRARYQGINPDELDVIPAQKQANFYEDTREKRVAVYARVSTDDPRQTSSYELQKNHYLDVVSRHEGWKLVDIYADEGISGTSLQHRDEFIRMIEDCKQKKIDLIVTKSVSRFARNVLDCIGYVRNLAAMEPPIGVFFETENIYTLNPNSEMSLSFISTLAQEESHNKSEIMNASIEMRFRRGIFLTPPLLGYDRDEDGGLVINEEEAKTVRLIFFMYLYGYTCVQIAETLTKLGRQTKKGNTTWSPSTVLQVLQNERHCGDVLARKTWTPNYLNHKSKKNNHDRNQYRKRDHHQSIISRDDFIAVQKLIGNAKYGHRGILPELQVIPDGALKGFVIINPRWGAFKAADYISASKSVIDDVIELDENNEIITEVTAQAGDFDLRGFEVARSQFFSVQKMRSMTFDNGQLKFGSECLKTLDNTQFIELLVHPIKKIIAVRPAKPDSKNAIKWIYEKNGVVLPRLISGAAYISTIYELFGWKENCKYRVRGLKKNKDGGSVLIFDMTETETFLPDILIDPKETEEAASPEQPVMDMDPFLYRGKRICAYPPHWADNFGSEYYRHAQLNEMAIFNETGEWKLDSDTVSYTDETYNLTPKVELQESIEYLLNEFREKETTVNG